MKWNHLPEAGGLYDQNPDLLDRFHYIMAEQNAHDRREHEKEMSKRPSQGTSRPTTSRGRRR